jgi:hypothetical protein
MDRNELEAYLDEAISGLKDFQAASVNAIYHGLYEENRPRMLLADEVGLGKTVVARGLIARLVKERIAAGKTKPLRVTYICSNQVIAGENLRKLNPFPKKVGIRDSISRIAYLAYEPSSPSAKLRQNLLELSTLTPATSFEAGHGTGNQWERRAIYATLCQDRKMWNRSTGLCWILRENVKNFGPFKDRLNEALNWPLRKRLADQFIRTLHCQRVPGNVGFIYDELRVRRELSLYEATQLFAERVNRGTWSAFWHGCHYLNKRLREALIECCLRYVDADLFILDEFQRFRNLIDEKSEDEQAQIARKVFRQQSDSRVLLLSATPFKAFTGHEDVERGEDHYKEFSKVLGFLLSGEEDQLGHYETHRKALHGQIIALRSGETGSISGTHRDEVQRVLRSVICRTERHRVAADPNALIDDVWKEPDGQVPFGPGDIENFRQTDRITRALSRIAGPVAKPIEYCKSALFPLSFLDRYHLKETLKEQRKHPKIRSVIENSCGAWLDLDRINEYGWSLSDDGGAANARLRMLLDRAVGSHGANLLWVPPSLPYYKLEDAFAGSEGFSKTLVFSSWIMVPRMISTLISYEIERRTIGDVRTIEAHENERRTYFTAEGKKRHPIPQIRYARRMVGGRTNLANLSNFTLLYPSLTLKEVAEPVNNLLDGLSLSELRQEATNKIQHRLDACDLQRYGTPDGERDRWYWAAPLLLDREGEKHRQVIGQWFSNRELARRKVQAKELDDPENDDLGTAKEEHYQHLKECFEDPSLIGLSSTPPDDLAAVLADLALGSPAVVTLRSLLRLFPSDPLDLQLKRAAEVADEFTSLFNKPEAIAAIRLSETHAWFWRMVADYCASGCLQAVLDEFFHLLADQNASTEDAVTQLRSAINLNAATIVTDSAETFLKGESQKMRCHYAVEFGSQRIETDKGEKRAASLREVFNSPFRPFVLSTTSIGQEGLDFHSYCRRIVHWNLPGNPIDLEQREGRINRYKSLVIRQQVASKYRAALSAMPLAIDDDPWDQLFRIADRKERIETNKCELIPYWHVEATHGPRIERVVPLYPFSLDQSRLNHILRTLAIYRLAFGQPRQAELVDHLLERSFSPEELREVMNRLVIDLSPMRR